MTFEFFIYTLDYSWYFYISAFLVTIANYFLITFLLEYELAFLHFPQLSKKLKWLMSTVASWLVVLPMSIVFSVLFREESDGWLTILFQQFLQITSQPFSPLMNSRNPFLNVIGGSLWFSLVFFPLILLIGTSFYKLLKKYSFKQKLTLAFGTFGLAVWSTILIVLIAWQLHAAAQPFFDSCMAKSSKNSHFSAHVEELCNKRPTLDECPKTETDLRAFNPKNYDIAETCQDSKYFFSEKYGHIWLERAGIFSYSVSSRNKKAPEQKKYIYRLWELPKLEHQYAE